MPLEDIRDGLLLADARSGLRRAVNAYLRATHDGQRARQVLTSVQRVLDILVPDWNGWAQGSIRRMTFPWYEVGEVRYQVVALCLDRRSRDWGSDRTVDSGLWVPALARNGTVFVPSLDAVQRVQRAARSPERLFLGPKPHLFRAEKRWRGGFPQIDIATAEASGGVALWHELDSLMRIWGKPGIQRFSTRFSPAIESGRMMLEAFKHSDAWWLRAPLIAHPEGQYLLQYTSTSLREIHQILSHLPDACYAHKWVREDHERLPDVLPSDVTDEGWHQILETMLPADVRKRVGFDQE